MQRIIERDGLVERVHTLGERFRTHLRAELSRYAQVGDVRGRGFFIGIELVRDPATKAPFPAERALSHEIGARCFEAGLIVYPCSGHVDGEAGDTLIVAPPYNVREPELEEIAATLVVQIGAALAGPG